MAHIVFACPGKIWGKQLGRGKTRRTASGGVACLLRLWRRACMVLAEWSSRALQHNELAQLNDHLLADIGLRREKQIVDASKLFCWLP